MNGGTTAALGFTRTRKSLTKIQSYLTFLWLSQRDPKRSRFFLGTAQGFVNGGTWTKTAIGEVGAVCSREVKV